MPVIFSLIPWVGYFLLSYFLVPTGIEKLMLSWQVDLRNLAFIASAPLLWLVAVKWKAAFSTAVGFDGEHCTLSYCRFYRFHRTVVNTDRISKVTVSQNPLQKISKTCNLSIYTNSETVSRHLVKGLNFEKLTKLLKENGYPF
jgi:putative membrane protein